MPELASIWEKSSLSFAWVKSVMMSAAGPMPEFCKRGEAESVVASSPGHGVLPEPADQGVVAGIAYQRVVAAEPGQHVVAGIASEDVGAVGADAVDERRVGQRQVLDAGVGPEVPRDGRGDGIPPAGIDDGVVGGPGQHIGVVAQPAHQDVGAGAAVQRVVAVVAD